MFLFITCCSVNCCKFVLQFWCNSFILVFYVYVINWQIHYMAKSTGSHTHYTYRSCLAIEINAMKLPAYRFVLMLMPKEVGNSNSAC